MIKPNQFQTIPSVAVLLQLKLKCIRWDNCLILSNYAELSFAYREGMIVPMARKQLRED